MSLALVASCGGSKEPATAPDEPSALGGDDRATGTDDAVDQVGADGDDSAGSPASIKTTGPPPPSAPGDFEPTYADCANLAAVYERLLRAEEMAKLEKKKLPPKVYASALKEVEQVVDDGASQWRGQCEGIVETVQIKPRWECAQQADSLARFNGCMNGEFDDELN